MSLNSMFVRRQKQVRVPSLEVVLRTAGLPLFRRLPFGRMEGAFTLIEVIGVLAVMGVLASLLVPKVFEVITSARLSAVPIGLQTVKAATLEHFVRYSSIASKNGAPLTFSGTYDGFDLILVTEGFLDKPFSVSVGMNATIRLVDVSGLGPDSDLFDNDHPGAYDLDGDGKNDIVGATFLLEAVIDDPARADVVGINNMLDGPALGAPGPLEDDSKGRVIYHDPSNAPDPHANPNAQKRRPGTMYIYIAHG